MLSYLVDHRTRLVALGAVLAVALVAGFLAPAPAEARVCIGSCEGGYWYYCCPTIGGGWYCWLSSDPCGYPPGP